MIGWLDAQAGASGDMFLGALTDAGVPLNIMQAAIDQLGLGITLKQSETSRGGIGGTKIDVEFVDDHHSRRWSTVQDLLQRVDGPVRGKALRAFERLAHAEAAVHRTAIDEVHFHEVGAHDALADIVGTAAGLAHLGLTELYCSPVALGNGTTHGRHGPIPLPAPAVLQLLTGAPITAGQANMESTTPTGAALLATFVTHWGPLPPITPARIGNGCGSRDPDSIANVLRLVIGEPAQRNASTVLLEANIDDLDPRLWPHVLERVLEAGAQDAWVTPILMKKGRPAHTLAALCTPRNRPAIIATIFHETSTIGLRETPTTKHSLDRTQAVVIVDGCAIGIKQAWFEGELVNVSAEWADVAAAARQLGRPAKKLLAEAISQASIEFTNQPLLQ
jgi:uncharacterized protein (TIGR00299 family) protein